MTNTEDLCRRLSEIKMTIGKAESDWAVGDEDRAAFEAEERAIDEAVEKIRTAVSLLRDVYDHGESFKLHDRICEFLGDDCPEY